MLTTLQIKSAKAQERAYKLADGGGLYLLVQPSGSKLWRYKFRIGHVEGLQALGAFPEVSLAEARTEHAKSRKLVDQSVHPVQERKRQREALAIEYLHRDKGAFETVYAQWDAATAVGLKSGTLKQRTREITNDLLPTLGGRPIASITRLEVTEVLKTVEKRAPEVARNLRNYLWGRRRKDRFACGMTFRRARSKRPTCPGIPRAGECFAATGQRRRRSAAIRGFRRGYSCRRRGV
ncbi:MAG: hypothetical protein DI564_09570 [Rhodanobacter denitrificans]|uniref:Uncharacterized protein n=1 Tax=Rhodanobacter denitrificans TaxID=666685 RepID=A0A2W5MBF6_9GAMM|nr:MAG: hypothetical protein DI564_09570 [Rhodanobacter denitrificans]